jgi:hypothetical protein
MKKVIAIALVGMIGLSSGAFALGNNFVAFQNIQTSSVTTGQ